MNKITLFTSGVVAGVVGATVITKSILVLAYPQIRERILIKYIKTINNDEQRHNVTIRDIVFAEREDAEEVLSALYEIIQDYTSASVADYNELTGMTSIYTDNNYGWTDLRNTYINRVKHGYQIVLPKPKRL